MNAEPLLISYTVFADVHAAEKIVRADVPWQELVQRIRDAPTYPDKAHCPLISLSEYGERVSDKGSVRFAENVLRVHGGEIDYDAGLVPMSKAAALLQDANIEAALYTTPSHTPEKPRWRAFLPFSEAALPEKRREFLGRANRVLGGIAADESFNLSRSFFVGRVNGVPYETAETHGRCIDLAAELEPLYSATHSGNGAARDPTTDAELRAAFERGEGRYEAMLKLSSRWAARGMAVDDIEAALLELLGTSAHNADGVDLRTRIRPLAETAVKKYGETRKPVEQVVSTDNLKVLRTAHFDDQHAEAEAPAPLADVEQFLARFVIYPSDHARVAHVLWIAHTHAMAAWESTPRIAFLSPEPGSGKTRALEISELLVPLPVEAINATPAYLFRKVADPEGLPTILFDEIDTLFGARAKEHEEIRGILNAGHRRGAMAGRCVVKGKTVTTEELPAYCAVALAGLGNLPDTILSRSIVIRMRRRAPTETVEPYRRRTHAPEGHVLRDRLATWIAQHLGELTAARPAMPDSVTDRAADVWESLLAVADVAGGTWPERARVSAVTHVTDARVASPSLGILLLTDIRTVFRDRDSMATVDLLANLSKLEESPWGDIKGKPLDARGMSRLLRRYGISPKTFRDGHVTVKGYLRTDLHDAWQRYVGVATKESVTTVTPVTHRTCPACDGEGCDWCAPREPT